MVLEIKIDDLAPSPHLQVQLIFCIKSISTSTTYPLDSIARFESA